MLNKLRHRPGIVIALVLLWKAILLVFTAQPVPANDSFFYDGAVVNWWWHGQYCNPSLANALPISGREIFTAYPPLYQFVLWGWLQGAGPSALAVMWLHFLLFALYAGLLLAALRELRVPAGAVHFASLFLLGITFHDRPDSLAHVWGMTAVWAWARAYRTASGPGKFQSSSRWLWLAAGSVVLCLATSLQIGGIFLLISLGLWLGPKAMPARLPAVVWTGMLMLPVLLMAGVKFGQPQWWAGFQEHARQTPSLTSWRLPDLLEIIKIVRSVPGLLLVLALLPMAGWGGRPNEPDAADPRQKTILLAASLAAVAVLLLALCFLTANLVLIAAYLQPLVVGVFLAQWAAGKIPRWQTHAVKLVLVLAVLLVSVRAIGLTTVGVACARDVDYAAARSAVARELAALPEDDCGRCFGRISLRCLAGGAPAAVDSFRLVRSGQKDQPHAAMDALRAAKPACLILTQFDYHRHVHPFAGVAGLLRGFRFRAGGKSGSRAPARRLAALAARGATCRVGSSHRDADLAGRAAGLKTVALGSGARCLRSFPRAELFCCRGEGKT